MSDLFQDFQRDIVMALQTLQAQDLLRRDLDFARVSVELPRDESHGDVASNAAMVLAKAAGLAPRQLAEHLVNVMNDHPDIHKIDIAGPGFLNFTFTENFWRRTLSMILTQPDYGASTQGHGIAVNVEYVSTNPTGPIHIGHCRGAVVGDVLANILKKAGYSVIKEYYINDAGGQVNHLARSAYQRYRQALGDTAAEAAYYGGDYLIPVGQQLAERYGQQWFDNDEQSWLPVFRDFTVDAMMQRIKQDLSALNIHHDVFTSEKALVEAGKIDEAFTLFENKGLIYRGVLPPPKGKVSEDYEPREQALFRSSDFGDDSDRPLKKSDGSPTYFLPDIAYHVDKYKRGAQHMILVLGADHAGYVSRLQAAVKAMSDNQVTLNVKLCHIVKFIDNGQTVKFSKRAGNFITVQEAIEKVGRDALRFMMVWRKNDAPLDIDFAKLVEQSRDNPVFYVQYAYARCHSIKRHAQTIFAAQDISITAIANADLSLLTDAADFELIKHLAHWPRIVAASAQSEEPHRIAYYLYTVASVFHALWNKGKENTELRFIVADDCALTCARLALVNAVICILHSGLEILGVEAKEEMRDE